MSEEEYSIDEHRHRFSVWAAHRAAFRGQEGAGAENVARWFKDTGFSADWRPPSFEGSVPENQVRFDGHHRTWREKMIGSSSSDEGGKEISHGRAAKAINVYLKARYVLTDPGSNFAVVAHPPIDRILLSNISREIEALRSVVRSPESNRLIAWTRLDASQYESMIKALRAFMGDLPFWNLEYLWEGSNSRDE